ncbi:MAG: LytR family transcriptional regulator [Ruminococcaceae bacterium]|nr:LytR family transcriptional regulator [Oscillospiraceae bacterium]
MKKESVTKTTTTSKKKNTKKIVLITLAVIIGVLIVTAVGVGIWAVNLWHNAEAPSNGSEGTLPFDTGNITPPNTSGPDQTKEPDNTDDPDKSKMYNFLLLGADKVAANTDVIMLISYNVEEKKIAVMQIPRDTYVEIDGTSHKINALYGMYYNEGVYKRDDDPREYGLSKLEQTLEQNLCININYHAMVNLEGFRNIVDLLGGVEVDLPQNISYLDEDQGKNITLKKGKQILDGKKAEGFVRFRSGYLQADIGRLDAQKIFMSALLKEVKNDFSVTTIVKIAGQIFKHVKTDIELEEMVYFAKNLLTVDMNNIKFMTLTGYSPTPPEGMSWYYVMNRKGGLQLINEYFNIYNFEITDSIFDQNEIFYSNNGQAEYLNKYYECDPENLIGGNISSADDINKGTIDIPSY